MDLVAMPPSKPISLTRRWGGLFGYRIVVMIAVILVIFVPAISFAAQSSRREARAVADAGRLTHALAAGLADQISRTLDIVWVVLTDVLARIIHGADGGWILVLGHSPAVCGGAGRRSGAAVGSMMRMTGFGLSAKGMIGAAPPRASNDQMRQAAERKPQDSLVAEGAGQADHDLGFPTDHAGHDFEQPQPHCIELRRSPGGVLRHQMAQRPHQPIGAGVQHQAQLVGRAAVA